MAKKSSGTKDAATSPKAGKKAGVKKTAVKKASKPKAETASKSGTPKATTKKSAPKAAATKTATKKSAPKKAAGPKLSDRHVDFLKKMHGAGESGYTAGKGEDRTITALGTRKLVKRGKKNTEGKYPYTLTKAGMKAAGGSSPSASGAGA